MGPPQPLTIGLTAMGFLCIFLRKYNCCVLGGFCSLKLRYSLVVLSIMPWLYNFCIKVLILWLTVL